MRRMMSFLMHRIASKSRHGVHSPFVYSLIDRCIYGTTKRDAQFANKLDKYLSSNTEVLVGEDFGADMKTERSVRELNRHSVLRGFELDLLLRLMDYHQPSSFLELGTNLGKTAAMLKFHNPKLELTTVEGNEAIASFARNLTNQFEQIDIKVINEHFRAFLNRSEANSFDMIFLDGDHRFEPTMEYYASCKKLLRGEGPIVLHDIYWSTEMQRAWNEIKNDREATVTIDLYFFALVYFKPGQQKQHFSVKFPRSLHFLFR